ncbi:MAG: CHAT domain-containing protein [Planctomycetota bacterium]
MLERRHVPLAALFAATIAAQQIPDGIEGLAQRAGVTPRPDERELSMLTHEALAHARRGVAAADRDAFMGLLSNLTKALQALAQDGRGEAAAAELHTAYRHADATGLLDQAVHFRRFAESSQLVGDLATMDRAVRRGLRAKDVDLYEQTLLLTLATRVQTQLGRLDIAQRYLTFTIRNAARLAAEAGSDPKVEPAYTAAVRNTVMTAADLYLMCGDYENTQKIVAGAPIGTEGFRLGDHLGDRGCRLYSLVARMLDDDEEAAEELLRSCVDGAISARFLSVIAPKLVRKAIADGDLPLAAERFRTLTAAFDRYPDVARLRRRLASQEMELATRGVLKAERDLRDRADDAFGHLLDSWRKSPLLADGVGLLHVDDRATLFANYIRFCAMTEPGPAGARIALQKVLDAHAASRHLEQAPTVEAVLDELLTAEHGMLVLLPGRITSVMLVADKSGVTVLELADAVELRPAAERLTIRASQFVDTPASSAARWQRSARKLSGLLLPDDVRTRIAGWRRLSVCGAGMLHNAPFELLPIEVDGRVRFLGEHLAIDYLANLTRAIETPNRRPPRSVLMVASLQTSQDGAKPVRMDRAALRPSLAHYGAQASLLDRQVVDTAILERLPNAGVVHLIGHGAHDPNSRFQNGIRFGDGEGGALWGEKIVDLDLSGLVAIVGSCKLGATPFRRGGEPMAASLAGALLQADARCVVVPLSNLTFGNHVAAMAIVHEQLGRGAPPAEALLAARRSLSKAGRGAAWVELMLMQLHGRGF